MTEPKSSKSDFWSHLAAGLQSRKQANLWRSLVPSEGISATMIERNGKSLVHFGSNDYLSLAWHPEVRDQFLSAATKPKVGSGASPLICGAGPEYQNLVHQIASWKGLDSAVVFSSGYAANVGAIRSVASREDLILSDAWNHACLIDGCHLSRAKIVVYPHADTDVLERLLAEHRSNHRFAFSVTDTVFSMDGDVAPIARIHELCEQHDAIGIADEAHASGVIGPLGRGVLAAHAIDGNASISKSPFYTERWIQTGTLSKAIGCSGGYVSGSELITSWMIHHARSWIYSTAMPAAILSAATKWTRNGNSSPPPASNCAIGFPNAASKLGGIRRRLFRSTLPRQAMHFACPNISPIRATSYPPFGHPPSRPTARSFESA